MGQKGVKNDPKMGYFDLFLAIFDPLYSGSVNYGNLTLYLGPNCVQK